MKSRYVILFAAAVLLLTACNFTLAKDVTPPPDYKPPTPMPTLGPLYPASAPDTENGSVIYLQSCAPCHGETGLGDGPQSVMLKGQDIEVPALGVAEIAQAKTPAQWYQIVTQGNLERFMPPFASLNDQQRWDVVAYAMSLHITPNQLEKGKTLCADCTKYFADQEKMSALSENDIVYLMKNGEGDIPAFGKDYAETDAQAVAAYLRDSTFAQPAGVMSASDSATQVPPVAETGTPAEGSTPQAAAGATEVAVTGTGTIRGSIDNQAGISLAEGARVTLRGYKHGTDMNAAPEEVLTLEGATNADGTYSFENVNLAEGLIFHAEVEVDGTTYSSEFVVAEAGATEVKLPSITIFQTTEDLSKLQIQSLQLFFDVSSSDAAQFFAVYTIVNSSDKTVVVKMGDSAQIPFIAFPAGSQSLGFEATQDTAHFLSLADGFAMPPSATPYGLIAYASLPKGEEISVSQPALLPIDEVSVLLPDGLQAKGDKLTDGGKQAMGSMNFQVYSAGKLAKGESLDFTLIGQAPQEAAADSGQTQKKPLLIGIGAFGFALIAVGGWMFWRDRQRNVESSMDQEDEEEDEEDSESLLDAIIALDDLHRSGKIPDEAYQQRRSELKDRLRLKS